jgi:exosortase A
MSAVSAVIDQTGASAARRGWPLALAILAGGAVVFGLLFWSEVVHAVGTWNDSTAYNHCFLILPISAYLIWERWRAIAARTPEPAPWPLAAMLLVALVWLFADRADLMEGRQLAAMALFQLFVLAVVGYRVWRVAAFALLYLFFLVPSGAFLTPYLQTFSAHFAVAGVKLLGIPVYADGMEIQVPGANFVIAEACAGLRFLIASVALGTLYGYMMYRSWRRRAAFMVVSIIVPIIANGFRCLGLVVYGYWLGNAEAALVDHILYGWLFFSIVSLTLIVLGLPFRQPVPAFGAAPLDVGRPRNSPKLVVTGAIALGMVALMVSPVMREGPVGAAFAVVAADLKHALHH